LSSAQEAASDDRRQLAAIVFTDIVGYTALSQKNEALAMQILEEHRDLVRQFFPKHNGREAG
jgi:adenylate cyclase